MIVNHIKLILSKFISKEQFTFLTHRQILDVVGVAQVCLHSIKVEKMKAVVLKVDLVEAYNKVSWSFLGLVYCRLD